MINAQEDNKINYPHFIKDKPEGKDLFEGQSQSRIADNIIQFINENNDNNRKVIGIEGEWGSGKSNVIEILKNKLKEEYYFFVFDAWGHQEDLTRRSILEELLTKLIKDDKLNGEKKIWDKELRTLLSKTKETQKRSIPQVSPAVIFSAIGILLTFITKIIVENYLKSYAHSATTATKATEPGLSNYLVAFVILMLPFLPLMWWIIKELRKAGKGEKIKVLHELFYVFKGQEIINTSEETISENEPSVLQFTNFLARLEKGAKNKLVIVFDNMDRLPSNKVKDIWSSIHTFFANEDNGLNTWAIVPFDNGHICNIFIEDTENTNGNNQRTDSYIHKTFSIVFHIPPPILSDWKKFFNIKFNEAFGYNPSSEQNIETIFDYHHADSPKIKPRDIIYFINDLVSLIKLWKEKIEFKYLAVYALKRNEIMKDPFKQIISRSYLASLHSLFEADAQLETNISALFFNVSIDKADEILLRRPIENALQGNGDLLQICNHNSFFIVFDSVFYSMRPAVINITNLLISLPEGIRDDKRLDKYWIKISDAVLQIDGLKNDYVQAIKTIIKKLKDKNKIEQVLKFLFSKAVMYDDKIAKLFTGKNYYKLIVEINSILNEIWKEKSIETLLSDNVVEPEEYMEFIYVCPNDYVKYKIQCENKKLNSFLIEKLDANEIDIYFDDLKVIKLNDDLSAFVNHVKALIPTLSSEIPEHQLLLGNIYNIDEILSPDGKEFFDVPDEIAQEFLENVPDHSNAIDFTLKIIKTKIVTFPTVTVYTGEITEILKDVSNVSSFIKAYKKYFDYSDLVLHHLIYPYPLTKEVIRELTKNQSGLSGNDASKLIGGYVKLKADVFDNDISLCNSFISIVNNFYDNPAFNLKDENTILNLKSVLQDNSSLNCALIEDIILQAIKFISELDKDSWLGALKKSETSHNTSLLTLLINLNKIKKGQLPTNLKSAYFETVKAIGKQEKDIPTNLSFWDNLFDLISEGFHDTYLDVRDELIKPGHNEITLDKLLFFEKGLFLHGQLDIDEHTADTALRVIFKPLISENEDYVNLLKRNSKSIKNIIDKARYSIVDFKDALDANCPGILSNDEVKYFYEPLVAKYNDLIEKARKEAESV